MKSWAVHETLQAALQAGSSWETVIRDDAGQVVCTTLAAVPEQAKARAILLVGAVNAHEDLLVLLARTESALSDLVERSPVLGIDAGTDVLDLLRDIRKSKGGA